MRMKKFLTILLTIAMVVSLLPATAFAANNTATTMRLAKTQGTVAVTNTTGKGVKQTGNMKLYNGYKVKTGAKSYAWISLDDTKVAKLDANSVMEVQKKGKSLTLYLSSGNMFFNVKDPLKSGETFSIKTSTMTTGIRGTSGCVRVISDRVTEIHLLTGQVMIYTEHPGLGVSKSAVLQAGQKATSLIDWEAQAVSGKMAEIVIEKLENHEICGICSKEIANDPELLARIEREAPHLLPEKAAAEADERLAADEKAAEEKQAAIDEKVAQQVFPEDVDPYFEQEESSGGGGGGSSAVTPSSIVEVATWGELVQAVSDYNDGVGTTEIRLTADIAAGANDDGLEPIENQGALTLNLGTNELKLNGTLVNKGNLTITNTAGYLALLDTVIGQNTPPVVVQNTGHLKLWNGTIVLNEDIGVHNSGIFDMTGGAIRCGTVTTTDGTSEFESALMPNGVGVYNSGIVNISGGMIEAATGIDDETQAGDTYNVTISGDAVVKGLSTPNVMGTALSLRGSGLISGGAISCGVLVYDGAVLDMTNGTVTAAGSERGISVSGGTVNLTGGAITTTAGLIANASPIGLTVEGGTVVLDGTDITANAGTAVSLSGGTTTFQSGTITAETDATAVQTVSNTIYNTAIKATIRAKAENAVFVQPNSGLPAGYQTALINNYYVLTETGGIVTWEQFVMAVDEFNAGTQAQTIRLGAAIIPPATGAATLAAIGATSTATGTKNPSLLTIDLNNYALTLPQTMFNEGDLLITGGTISADYRTVSTLIQNSKTLELANARMNLSMNQTGIANAAGTVNMTSGTIQLNSVPSYGIVSDNGAVNLNGGEIILVGCGSSSVNYGIQGINTAITINGGTVREGGGIVNTTANKNILVSADGGSLKLESGTITAHYGTAVSVSNVSVLTLDSATVKGKDADKLLVTANGVETGYGSVAYDATYYQLAENVAVTTWAAFESAVQEFNSGTSAFTITLAADINPAANEVSAAVQQRGTLNIGNGTANGLTIDLAGRTLSLPVPLSTTTSSPLEITGDTTGTITTGQAWTNGQALIINNVLNSKLTSGTLTVPAGVTGVKNAGGTFELAGGSINVTGGTGVSATGGSTTLKGTGITVSGTDATGISVANGAVAEMNVGTSSTDKMLTVSSGTGVNVAAGGSFTHSSGMIRLGASGKGIVNAGTLSLAGGTIHYLSGNTGNAVENSGIATMSAGEIGSYAKTFWNKTGGQFTMSGGNVTAFYDAAISMQTGTTTQINGGTVTAGDTYAVALQGPTGWTNTTLTVNLDTGATVRAKDAAKVISPAHEEYISDETIGADNYYHLIFNEEYAEPVEVTVNNAADFITEVVTYDYTADKTITLENFADITVDENTLATVLAELGIPESSGLAVADNGNSTYALTIGLGSNTLTLDTPLINKGNLNITGNRTVGTVETSSGTTMINNSGTLSWNGGKINAAAGQTGINNRGILNLNGGAINVTGGTGIDSIGNTVNLSGGIIEVNNGTGVASAGGTVNLSGATLSKGSGEVLSLFNDATATMTAGSVYDSTGSGVGSIIALDNGSTFSMEGGTMIVNSAGYGFELDNGSALEISGGTIDLERDGSVAFPKYATDIVTIRGNAVVNAKANGATVSQLQVGTLNLYGGTINVNAGGAMGVQVLQMGNNVPVLTVNGAVINVIGDTTANAVDNYGLYCSGGTVNVLGGTIAANGDHAYALYSENWSTGTLRDWTGLTVNVNNATVTAATAANVITPSHVDYGTVNNGDGYYKLTTPN